MIAAPHFDEYRSTPGFGLRGPDESRIGGQDEIEDLSADINVISLEEAFSNQAGHAVGEPDDEGEPADVWLDGTSPNKFLWLVRSDDVKIVLEDGALRRAGGGMPKHTNLASGAAHCGGELWFRDSSSVYINGGSGRFPPRCAVELDAIVAAFRKAGYGVCSFGWNSNMLAANRVIVVKDIQWL